MNCINTVLFPAYNYCCFYQGLNEFSEEASELDQKNALALAIATTSKKILFGFLLNTCIHGFSFLNYFCSSYLPVCFNHLITESPSNIGNGLDPTSGASGWELALVTAPSSNGSAVTESKLVKALLFPHGYCRNFPTVMLIAFVCCKNGISLWN